MFYDNQTLFERFPKQQDKTIFNGYLVKSFIRGHIPKLYIQSIHFGSSKYTICNGMGKLINFTGVHTNKADFENYYFVHFFSKSTEEFVNKLKRGDAAEGHWNMLKIYQYFKINKVSKKKIKYIEKKLNLNLEQYKNHFKSTI